MLRLQIWMTNLKSKPIRIQEKITFKISIFVSSFALSLSNLSIWINLSVYRFTISWKISYLSKWETEPEWIRWSHRRLSLMRPMIIDGIAHAHAMNCIYTPETELGGNWDKNYCLDLSAEIKAADLGKVRK